MYIAVPQTYQGGFLSFCCSYQVSLYVFEGERSTMISSIEVVSVLEDAGSLLALRLAGLPLLTVSTALPGVPQHACMCSLVCTSTVYVHMHRYLLCYSWLYLPLSVAIGG